ncbi:MAG: LPS export ABC transporter periplasmic protein LptC [Deltaproteobacteria bacterium]|nr:LPS export ABC transporter periplasmic protein LptC [Deltaproteobacteria bacterium]
MFKHKDSWYSVIFFVVLCQVLLFSPSQVFEPVLKVSYPSKADLVLEGFSVIQAPYESGEKINIQAEHANVFQEQDVVLLDIIHGFLEDKEGKRFFFESKKGQYFPSEQKVVAQDRVTMRLPQGYEIKTEKLNYLNNGKSMSSDEHIEFSGPDLKKPELILKGRGLFGDVERKEYRILYEIYCEKKDFMDVGLNYTITSQSMKFLPATHKAVFVGDVHVVQKDFLMTSDTYEVFVKSQGGEVNKAIAKGRVKIKQGERSAKAESATFINSQKRLILKGDPEVVIGENTLRGDVIIFHTDTQKIESYNVEGEFDEKS